MSKKIKTLIGTLIIATMASTTVFGATTTSMVYERPAECVVKQADGSEIEYNNIGSTISATKSLTDAGDGTKVYKCKENVDFVSYVTINNTVNSTRRFGETMLYAKGAVTVNFVTDKKTCQGVYKINPLNYKMENGKLVCAVFDGYSQRQFTKNYIMTDAPGNPNFNQNKVITLNEPGLYVINVGGWQNASENSMLYIGSESEDLSIVEPKVESAVAASLNVKVNDKTTALPAYSINGENYIRPKDLAYILNNTTRQFDVAIGDIGNMITYRGYVPNGSELKAFPVGNAVATPYAGNVMMNNHKIQAPIYTINNYNFISLSDMKFLLNLDLTIDGNNVTINGVTKKTDIPTDSDGRIKTDIVYLDSMYYESYSHINSTNGYNAINVACLSDEQVKDELKRFDTNTVFVGTIISNELMDYLKANYEVKK